MSNIDESNISVTDSSMNIYQQHIDKVKSVMNKDNEYNAAIGPGINRASNSEGEISSYLQGLSFSTANISDDIVAMNDSYDQFYNDLQRSNEINSRLRKIVAKTNVTEGQLKNAQRTNTYYMLLVWMIIFIFVVSALFLSIIEDKKDMNFFSKSLLVVFLFIVFFYIAKNSWFYIERNIQ